MSGEPEVVVIANPVSGRGRAVRVGEEIVHRLGAMGIPSVLELTAGPGDATRIAREAVARGSRRIAAVGGDGTVHEAAAGIAGSQAALGIVPCGRGNDIARVLGVPHDLPGAADLLARGKERAIDLGRVGDRTFLTVASLGFDAEVAEKSRRSLIRLPGALNYVGSVLSTVATYRMMEVELEGDFGRFSGSVLLVATANMSTYGGGMKIAPGALCDDGLLDVCIVHELPRHTLLRLFPRVFTGTHTTLPFVEMRRTRRLTARTSRPARIYADGEPIGDTPASIEVDAGSLQVLVPRR